MDAYKKAIEEIVHPLDAPERRKNTLRRELWAHFCALVDEERRNGVEESASMDKAFRRLGTADELRTTFCATLPALEMFAYRLDQRVRRSPGETARRYVWRVGSPLVLGSFAFATLIGVLCVYALDGTVNLTRGLMPFAAILTVCIWGSILLTTTMWRAPRLERLLRSETGCTRRVLMAFTATILRQMLEGGIAAFALLFLGYQALGWTIGFHSSETLSYLFVTLCLITFVGFTAGTVIPYGLVRDRQHAQPIPDWPYLERD